MRFSKHRCPVCKKPFGGWGRKRQKVSAELSAAAEALRWSEGAREQQEQRELEAEKAIRKQARLEPQPGELLSDLHKLEQAHIQQRQDEVRASEAFLQEQGLCLQPQADPADSKKPATSLRNTPTLERFWRLTATTSRKSVPERPAGSRLRQCPVCTRMVHAALLEQHVQACLEQPPNTEDNGFQADHQEQSSEPPAADRGEQHGASGSAQSAGDAFSRLMARPRKEIFNASVDSGGQWKVRWETSQEQVPELPSAWCGSVKLADKARGTSTIVTLNCNADAVGSADQLQLWAPDLPCNQRRPPKLSPSMLKSVLQKNVRLCRPLPAVKTALEMLKLKDTAGRWIGFDQLVRRLTIIIIEDAVLHPAYDILIWFMMASSKGWIPPASAIQLVLAITFKIAAVRSRDVSRPKVSYSSNRQPSLPALDSPSPGSTLVRALLARASFGGMAGDVSMLQASALLWGHRFEVPDWPDLSMMCGLQERQSGEWLVRISTLYSHAPQVPSMCCVQKLTPLANGDVPRAAMDFHVCGVIPALLASETVCARVADIERDARTFDELLKRTIWLHRSSINLKELLAEARADQDLESLNQESSEKQSTASLWCSIERCVEEYAAKQIKTAFQ